MQVSFVAALLWAAGFLLHAALLAVLLYRRRRRLVPWFTGWIAFQLLYTAALFFAFRLGSRAAYRDVYWSCAFVEFGLQIAVVLEIAASVLKRSGRWVAGARARMAAAGSAAAALAFWLAWHITPAAQTRLDAWDARASLFTTLLICLLFTSIMAASQQLGLGWRSHVMREGYGLAVWVLVAFLTDTLHAYWRTAGSFTALEQVRMVVYLGSLVYWIIAFSIPEREQAALPSDMLERLHSLGLPGGVHGNPPNAPHRKGAAQK